MDDDFFTIQSNLLPIGEHAHAKWQEKFFENQKEKKTRQNRSLRDRKGLHRKKKTSLSLKKKLIEFFFQLKFDNQKKKKNDEVDSQKIEI